MIVTFIFLQRAKILRHFVQTSSFHFERLKTGKA
jgi:hypothetical protein